MTVKPDIVSKMLKQLAELGEKCSRVMNLCGLVTIITNPPPPQYLPSDASLVRTGTAEMIPHVDRGESHSVFSYAALDCLSLPMIFFQMSGKK